MSFIGTQPFSMLGGGVLMIKMIKKIKESRWWCNFKDSVKFYASLRDPDPHEGDKFMNDVIDEYTRINKKMGLPPPDKWCEENPYRTM